MILPKENTPYTRAKKTWEAPATERFPPASDKLPEGAHREPPQGYPPERSSYATADWYALPVDTAERTRNASSRFPQMAVYPSLSIEEKQTVGGALWMRQRHFGIHPGDDILLGAGYTP